MTDFSSLKALVSDFDGTLVGINLKPSKKVKKAIKKLINNGYFFSIATGRIYQGIIRNICKELALTSPQITSGGSAIIDPQTDNVLWHQHIPSNSAAEVIKVFLNNNYQFAVESQGIIFTPAGFVVKEYGPGVIFKKLAELDYNTVSKIVLEGSSLPDLPKISDELSAKFPVLHVVRSGMKGSPVLDITSAKATKHLAVLELARILKIDPRFMVGVGDGYNDYPLLSACGFKIAMDSAPKELKEIADLVVPGVANDGLAVLINKLT